jgi:hypothetical protein
MRKTLTEIANSKTSPTTGPIDKGTIHNARHSYTYFYDTLFTSIRDNNLLILEIGICGGGSLKLWEEYFPNATIIGLDINDESELSNDRTHVFQLDQSNEEELQNFVNQCKENGYEFDIIIDDGSHHIRDQQLTLGYLFPLLKSKGIYIIEDLHTSLADNGFILYGKPLEISKDKSNTTISYLAGSSYSRYINEEQNIYLENNIDTVTIHNRFNQYQEPQYKRRSVTSAIIKK